MKCVQRKFLMQDLIDSTDWLRSTYGRQFHGL